jgi:hypothetical protein
LFLVEIVAACAVGFAALRWACRDIELESILSGGPYLEVCLTTFFHPFIAFLAVTNLFGMMCERFRPGQASSPWGLGRLTWTISGAFILVHGGFSCLTYWISADVSGGKDFVFAAWTKAWLMRGTNGTITLVLIALWVTYALMGRGSRRSSDWRERSGVAFGVAIIACSLLYQLVWWYRQKGLG